MSFVKMRFICDKFPNHLTLHSLYTSIRYLVSKDLNSDELFQIWQDGRTIYIVMDDDKVENTSQNFNFNHENESLINIRLVEKNHLLTVEFEEGEYVYIRGVFSYAYKHFDKENPKKYKLSCPINIKGLFKKDLKTPTFNYLEKVTGLDFNSEKNTDKIKFERIFTDEKTLYDSINNGTSIEQKILMKNIISIDATLKIKDIDAFMNIVKGSIGKKKNYGFGKLFIEKMNIMEE